jgi:tRNA A37 threonylcarbamoyladenosine dehydratase
VQRAPVQRDANGVCDRHCRSQFSEIAELSRKIEDEVIAVIGLGGSGANALEYLVKTPAREIRGFDGDAFHVHNVFRSSGRLTESERGQLRG